MDFQEATKVIYTRLQEIEPAHATKLLGWMLMQEYSETQIAEVSRLSHEDFCSAVNKAKIELNLVSKIDASKVLVESNPQRVEFQAEHEDTRMTLRGAEPLAYLRKKGAPSPSSQVKPASPKPASSNTQQQPSPLPLDQVDSCCEQDQRSNTNTVFTQEHPWHPFLKSSSASSSSSIDPPKANSASLGSEIPDKYYTEDSGSDVHSEMSEDSQSSQRSKSSQDHRNEHGPDFHFPHSLPTSPTHERNSSSDSNSSNKFSVASPPPSSRIRQLGKLESELQELLRAKQLPVSISSLPQLYFEKYGKTLQADGYLTESQRQGKSGYSLTRLLSKMKSTMVLIDRPNGQRAVALKEFLLKQVGGVTLEDIQVYSAALPEYNEVNPSSRQIYLTFPAESIFTEEDVAAHFRAYGVVQDVRIPNQQKRMFGFVTFASHITVQAILSEGNPHYICGARVLVKPYKEKGKHSDKSKKGEKTNMSLNPLSPSFNHPSTLSAFKADEERLMGLGLGLNPTSYNPLVPGTESQRLTEIQFVDAQRRRLESEARALAIQQQNLMNKAKEQWYKHKVQSQMQANSQDNLNQMISNNDISHFPQGTLTHLPTQQTRLSAHQPQVQIPSMMYSPYASPQQQQMLFPYPKMNLSSLHSFTPQIDDQTIPAAYPQSPNHVANTNFGLTGHQSGFLGSPQKSGNFQVYPPTIHMNNSTTYAFNNLTLHQKAANYTSGLSPKVESSDHTASFNPYESVVSNLVDESDENVSNFQSFVYEVKTDAKSFESDYEDKLPDSPFSSSSATSAFHSSGFSKEYFHGLSESTLNPDANYTHIDNNKINNYSEDLLSHFVKNMSLSSPSLQSSFIPYYPPEANQLSTNTPLPCSICFERNPSNISLGCRHFYCMKCLPQIKNGCLVCVNHPSSFDINNGQHSVPNWGGSKLYSESKLSMW